MIWRPCREEGSGTSHPDHINIYSKSSSPLGRALSNFFQSTFTHPDYGMFKSVEGFYYWLLTGKKHNVLKDLHGYEAKKQGKEFDVTEKINNKFKEQIKYAMGLKVFGNEYIKNLIVNSELPFAHYYYYGDKDENPTIHDRSKKDHYLIDAAEEIRLYLKHGKII